MRRFLIVDDEVLAFDDDLRSENKVDGIPADVVHINPTDYFNSGNSKGDVVVNMLLEEVRERSAEFWDVVAIDLNLGDPYHEEFRNKEICLRVAEKVREQNRSAIVFLYSGTLAKFINDILASGASDTQLRRIFQANVENFVPRNRIASQVTAAVDDPSWILRVDRMLMQLAHLNVTPEEAEFSGRSFGDLAVAVRRQDKDGQRVIELVSEYGISAFTDLNS